MGQVKHTKNDCIKALQETNENIEGKLSISKYRDERTSPSARTIIKRFESWNKAKEKAGLKLDGPSEEKIEKAEKIYKDKEVSLQEVANELDIPYSTLHAHISIETRDWSEIERDEEWCRKISEAQKGRELSEETKNKIGEIHKGKTPWNKNTTAEDDERVKKQGSSGENHWAWKGGISRKLNRLRQTPKYKKWRTQVFERDNYTCQKCGQKGGDLNAHHIKSFSEHEDHRFDIDNGKTLCKKCHKEVHR